MSSHPSDHTCDSPRKTDQPWKFSVCTILMYELRMCSRSFFGTIIFAAWEKIFHLDYQQRFPPFQISVTILNHCGMTHTLLSGKQGGNIVIVSTHTVFEDSGKLQLVDATGALDVMIPDLQCFANLSSTYQMTSFSLVLEGKWRTSTQSAEANCGRLPNSPVAWSTLLKGLVLKMEASNLLSYYGHLQIQHASCLKNVVWPSRETCTRNPSWLRKFNQIEDIAYRAFIFAPYRAK